MPSAEEAGDMLLERFGQITYQFLDASVEVWKEDEDLQSLKRAFDVANEKSSSAKLFTHALQKKFVADFQQLFSRIEAKDESVLDEPVVFLQRIKAREKFDAASAEIRETCWEYARQIVQSATMGDVYEKCPSKMVERVASMADKIVKDMQSGSFDVSKLNPMELSQEMLKGIDPASLEEWGNSLKTTGNMDHIMHMMTNMLGDKGSPLGSMMGSSGLQGMMSNPAFKDMLGPLSGDMSAMMNSAMADGGLASMMNGGGLASMMNGGALASLMSASSMD